MKSMLLLAVAACLLGACLAEASAKPDPSPKALAEALPQGAVGDLLSGLSTLLQNLLMALLGGGMASMMSGGGDGGSGEGGACCECGNCGCECCITTCFQPVRQVIPVVLPNLAQIYGLY